MIKSKIIGKLFLRQSRRNLSSDKPPLPEIPYFLTFSLFYFSTFETTTAHSTWLDCSILMSSNRAILGKSARSFAEFIKGFFGLKNRHFLTALGLGNRSLCLFLPEYKHPHRSFNRLKTSFWGNMSEKLWIPVASTLMLPEPILAFSVSGHRLNDSMFHHFLQKIRSSGCFNINRLHYVWPPKDCLPRKCLTQLQNMTYSFRFKNSFNVRF